MKKPAFTFLVTCSALLQAQVELKGSLLDAQDHSPLAFVNIGIRNKNVGAVSTEQGDFVIRIPKQYVNDTLSFSMAGYYDLSIPVQQILAMEQNPIALRRKVFQLPAVEVKAKKLRETRYGIKKSKPKIHFIDASLGQDDSFEIAQLIALGNNRAKVASVNLLINVASRDSCLFRINFYDYDGTYPTRRIVEQSITEKRLLSPGWLSVDLKPYNIYLEGKVVVAIEFVPLKKNNPVKYEVKLGGFSRSFVRTSSLGSWNVPLHHYRLFVTTLEGDDNTGNPEAEEPELAPDVRLFSKAVGDSFSVFVRLPKDYEKNKSECYPVLFLLDGNAFFELMSSSVQRLSAKKEIREPIVVGIGYRHAAEGDSLRDRDYSYPQALPADSFAVSGGADKFLNFIQADLIPYVDKRYRTDPGKRTLAGHSLGGYFPLFALYQQELSNKGIFKNYVAASPSLAYHNGFLIDAYRRLTIDDKNPRAHLFITLGALEDKGADGEYFHAFNRLLSDPKFKQLKITERIYPHTDHMDSAVRSFEEALQLFFPY